MERINVPHPAELHTLSDVRQQMEAEAAADPDRLEQIAKTFDPENGEIAEFTTDAADFSSYLPLADEVYDRIVHARGHEQTRNPEGQAEALRAEVERMPSHNEFAALAQDIAQTVRSVEDKGGQFAEGLETALVTYVDGEDNHQLATLASLIIDAEKAKRSQVGINRIRGQERFKHRHAEKEKLELKQELQSYGNRLRTFIFENRENLTYSSLMQWLGGSESGSDINFAKGEVRGAAREVAIRLLAESLPEVTAVRFSTTKEDVEEYTDLIIYPEGKEPVRLDVKGMQRSSEEGAYLNGHDMLGIDIRRISEDFQVKPDVRLWFEREVRKLIHKAPARQRA